MRSIGLILLILALEGAAFGKMSISQMAGEYTSSLVAVTALDETGRIKAEGSGFFVNRHGHIATNYHVLSGSVRAIVTSAQGEKRRITRILKADPDPDLVIADTAFSRSVPAPLGDSDRIEVGEPVIYMGSSDGNHGIMTMGAVTHLRRAGGLKIIQVSAPILPGYSGGPVFASSGRVIGIATAFLDLDRDLNFAMPVNYLKSLRSFPSELGDLPKGTQRLTAALRNRTLVEILVINEPANLGRYGAAMGLRGKGPGEGPAWNRGSPPSPGTVFFKNGKRLLCDRAWKQGSTVFLVVHGRKYAVGYDQSGIDMERSFRPTL